MSELLNQNPIQQHYKRTPKKFLKKGEGLKRFAAYRPPLPVVANRRRQTFVKFKLDHTRVPRERHGYLPPDILYDDSINLSTEIPKIAPPKIMHTPIKPPNRQASKRYNLRSRRQFSAIVERHVSPSPSLSSSSTSPTTLPQQNEENINENIDNLMRKIKEKKTILNQENVGTFQTVFEKDDNENDRSRTPVMMEPNRRLKIPAPIFESPPSTQLPVEAILALGKQIQQIQSTVNELKEGIKNCKCGVKAPSRTTTTGRSTRRTQAKSNEKVPRLSADADKSTPKILDSLVDEIAQLKERFDGINLRR